MHPLLPVTLVAPVVAVLIACSPGSPAVTPTPDNSSVLSGTVTYRERMALPPDAVIEVRLSDISRMDVAAPVVAEATLRPEGRRVPIPFELRYDAAKLDPTRIYGVRATIRISGALVFVSETSARVITQGHPTRADLLLVRTSEGSAGTTPSLNGTAWLLEDLGGAGVVDRVQATLEFPEPGRVAGRASCNRFFGSVQLSGSSLRIGQVGSTEMACAPAVMNQEARYLQALADAERFAVEGPYLLVYYKGSAVPLRFTRQAP